MADRYTTYYVDDEGNSFEAQDGTVDENGKWVLFSDYDALETQNNQLQSENDDLKESLEGSTDTNADVKDIVKELKAAYGISPSQDFNRMLAGTSERQYQALKALFEAV